MPSLSASPARSAERYSTTSQSSVSITYGASSPSTCTSIMKRVRTKLSGTSSRFHGLSRKRDASTQSPYSVGSITTTDVSLDERVGPDTLRADEICSQHGRGQRRELLHCGGAGALRT